MVVQSNIIMTNQKSSYSKKNLSLLRMKQKLLPGFLFMIMMIMVLHNAIPHHHHQGVLMHNHDLHQDGKDHDSDNDHKPEQCLIQSLDLGIPRALQTTRQSIQPEKVSETGILNEKITLPDSFCELSLIHAPPGSPPVIYAISEVPARAPPC
jgi:hypothetical protein